MPGKITVHHDEGDGTRIIQGHGGMHQIFHKGKFVRGGVSSLESAKGILARHKESLKEKTINEMDERKREEIRKRLARMGKSRQEIRNELKRTTKVDQKQRRVVREVAEVAIDMARQLDENFSALHHKARQAHKDALKKSDHHGDMADKSDRSDNDDEFNAHTHKSSNYSHAARHFGLAAQAYQNRDREKGDNHMIHAHSKLGLNEDIGPIERNSNAKNVRKDGTQAGPDPEVQRELKHQGVLARAAKMRKQMGVHEETIDEDYTTYAVKDGKRVKVRVSTKKEEPEPDREELRRKRLNAVNEMTPADAGIAAAKAEARARGAKVKHSDPAAEGAAAVRRDDAERDRSRVSKFHSNPAAAGTAAVRRDDAERDAKRKLHELATKKDIDTIGKHHSARMGVSNPDSAYHTIMRNRASRLKSMRDNTGPNPEATKTTSGRQTMLKYAGEDSKAAKKLKPTNEETDSEKLERLRRERKEREKPMSQEAWDDLRKQPRPVGGPKVKFTVRKPKS